MKSMLIISICCCFFLTSFSLVKAEDKTESKLTSVANNIPSDNPSNNKIAAERDDYVASLKEIRDIQNSEVLLRNKIASVEEKIVLTDNNFNRIANSQKDILTTMLYWVIAIMTALLGASWLNNTIIIRITVKKAKEDIQKEFAAKINVLSDNIKETTEGKFKIIEDKHSCNFLRLEGFVFNAIGRVYEETKNHDLGALWFARGLGKFMECGTSSDKWLKLQINRITFNLKSSFLFNDPEWIKDVQEVIEAIPEDKFKSEKESLQEIFSKAIKKTSPVDDKQV